MNKNSRLTIRIKESEKEKLQKEAEKQGRTLSNYVSLLLIKGREIVMKKGLMIAVAFLFIGCGHQDTAPTWTSDQKDAVRTGCIDTASGKASAGQVASYCECVTEAVVNKFTPSDFNANPSDAQELYNDGTVASCKTKAGL